MKRILLYLFVTGYLLLVTSTPTFAQAHTKEEYAVYNRCELNSPRGVCPKPPVSFLESIVGFIPFLNSYFWQKPENADRLEEQAQIKQKALMPKEITDPTAENQDAIEDTIGPQTGIYGYTMPNGLVPKLNQPDNQGTKTECIANNAWFPDGVNIFTSTEDCPPQGKGVTTGQ